MIALALWAAGALAVALDAPWWVRGLALPAVLWAPGLPWARRLGHPSAIQRGLDAAWIGVALAVPGIAAVRLLGGGAATLLALSGIATVAGLVAARGRPAARPPSRAEWVGCGAVVAVIAAWALAQSPRLSRDLDSFWYLDRAQDAGALGEPRPLEVTPGPGFEGRVPLGWPEAGAARLVDPEGDGGTLHVREAGRLVVALQGPVGASLELAQGEHRAGATIQRDVVEDPDEGPVPRYQDRGVAGVLLEVGPGPVQVRVRQAPGVHGPTTLFLLAGPEAVWALDADGSLRFVHYYQLLNIVENQRWAEELLRDRWLTLAQPPLWSHVLAVAVLLVHPGLPGANLLLLLVTVLLGCSGVRLLTLLAPRAPPPAWLLPAAASAVHLKLAVDPGSTNFPDSLFAAALVGAVAALCQPGAARVAGLGVAAGLLRYPGIVDVALAGLVQRLVTGRLHRRGLAALGWTTAGLAAAGALVGLLTGQLQHALEILWFETIPEHYHGEFHPLVLLGRLPAFYGTWIAYSGGTVLLAGLVRRCPGAHQVLGSALAWSLLLCTIDHLTTHYFFPLVPMAAVALGIHAGCRAGRPAPGPLVGWGLSLAGLAGLAWFTLLGHP